MFQCCSKCSARLLLLCVRYVQVLRLCVQMTLILFFLKIILKCNFMSVESSNTTMGASFVCLFNFNFLINLFLLYPINDLIHHGLVGGGGWNWFQILGVLRSSAQTTMLRFGVVNGPYLQCSYSLPKQSSEGGEPGLGS